MRAKFPGRCPGGDRINLGDTIARDGKGRWAHPGHGSRLAVTYAAASNEPYWGRVGPSGGGPDPDLYYEEMRDARALANYEAAEARRERERNNAEYAAGRADADRYRFNRDMFGEGYAAAEEAAWDSRLGLY